MRLSATLIVKNESRFIEDCLSSLAGIVDEIVVVDTGSTDDTVERARRYPVKLGFFPWCDDFSAARNAALEQATGDWILYIDADERFRPLTADWRQQIDRPDIAAARLRLHPRVGWTAYSELRLFRRDPRIRFEGVVHERVHGTVDAVCRADGLHVGMCDVALDHVGYEDDQAAKVPRNLPLLRRYLAEDPNRVYCWWHLGDQLKTAGDNEGAVEAWRNGIAAIARLPASAIRDSESTPYLSLIQHLHGSGEAVDALLAEARARFPRHLALQWIEAKIALERGDIAQALPVFERLAAIDAETFHDEDLAYDKAIFTHLAQESLALAAFRSGRFADAAVHYRQAALTAPNRQEMLVKASLASARAGSL
ncbi:glycosyltransferase [Phreatobacter aquaticus]|uniref:Glycosyltransferase n=1 Tax=Phreatobacter aquaticus TaxID=2570229 RepID=A0A4D7QQ92_9HYPH|nr:glycosyltransferase family 2 protein [Phreatobacter aquaticus]QCK87796.1 glycosyltransferase [Phreatobacter aquaticus]